MMRRNVIAGLAILLLSLGRAGAEQSPGKIPRVGILTAEESERAPKFEAFRARLGELGYSVSLVISKAATSFSNFGFLRVIFPVFRSWRRSWWLYRSMSSWQRAPAPTHWTRAAAFQSCRRY